ncbi:hypothetical protein [Crenothrix sp.]|uniref:hypothetical protein n=1 Tax=Crenothrix sp. TaxID=3100433 RepID=UPI00374D2058
MKILPLMSIFITLASMTACNNDSKSTSVGTIKSAQKEADEFAKSFNKQTAYKPKTPDHTIKSTTSKKSDPTSAGIVGMPKDTVEGVKNIIEDTKDVVNKAVDSVTGKASNDKIDTNKAPGNDSTSGQTDKNAASAQTAAEKEAPADNAQTDAANKNPSNAEENPTTSSAGIVGLPKGVVEGAKTMAEDTKNAVTQAVDAVTDKVSEDKSGNSSKSSDTMVKKVDKDSAPAITSNSAQKIAEKEAPADNAQSDAANKNPSNAKEKTATTNAGIVGLPKDAVEGVKTMVEDTKNAVNKAVESVSGTNEPEAKDSKAPANN